MCIALMRIICADKSNEVPSNDPLKFLDYFDTVRSPLLCREKDGSPEEVIENIKRLQSLTGRFKRISDVFCPDLLAASLIKQDSSKIFICDGWHPLFYGHDSPEGYYYILRLDQDRSNWSLTYYDAYGTNGLYGFETFGVTVEVTGCHPNLWPGKKGILSISSIPEGD